MTPDERLAAWEAQNPNMNYQSEALTPDERLDAWEATQRKEEEAWQHVRSNQIPRWSALETISASRPTDPMSNEVFGTKTPPIEGEKQGVPMPEAAEYNWADSLPAWTSRSEKKQAFLNRTREMYKQSMSQAVPAYMQSPEYIKLLNEGHTFEEADRILAEKKLEGASMPQKQSLVKPVEVVRIPSISVGEASSSVGVSEKSPMRMQVDRALERVNSMGAGKVSVTGRQRIPDFGNSSLGDSVRSWWGKTIGLESVAAIDGKRRSIPQEELQRQQVRESEFREALGKQVKEEDLWEGSVAELPTTEDGSVIVGGKAYAPAEANMYLKNHLADKEHERRFADDDAYRNEWFLKNTGMTETRYRNKTADELEQRLAELERALPKPAPQNTRGGYAAVGAAANRPGGGRGGIHVAKSQIEKARKALNSLRKNNFIAGAREGFDVEDILTLGFKGVGDNVTLLRALNAQVRGDKLNREQQVLVDAWQYSQEAEAAIAALGGRSLVSRLGYGVGWGAGFMSQMALTGGIASVGTKGITTAVAKRGLQQTATKGTGAKVLAGLQKGVYKLAESAVGAVARMPFTGMGYKNYTDKRLSQFEVKSVSDSDGHVRMIINKMPSSPWKDALYAAIEAFFEFQSEDVGMWISRGMSQAAKKLAATKMGVILGLSKLKGFKRNAAMNWIGQNAKIAGLAGETLGEAYGDAMVNLFEGSKEGWRHMMTGDYWWEVGGVSAILSGSFGAMNAPGAVQYARQTGAMERLKRRSLEGIENEALKSQLVTAASLDNLAARSEALGKIDWKDRAISKEDAARAVDFINTQTQLDIMQGARGETERLERAMPLLEQIPELGYRGIDGKQQPEEVVQAATQDGRFYFIVAGDMESDGLVEVWSPESGKREQIGVSEIWEVKKTDLSDYIAEEYAMAFGTQADQEQLDRIRGLAAEAAEAGVDTGSVNGIIRNAGYAVYDPGDEVRTVGGEVVVVAKTLGGAYEVVHENGAAEVYGFNEILQPDARVAAAQRAAQRATQPQGTAGREFETEAAPANKAVEQAMEVARQEVDAAKNLDDGVVYEATMKDGSTVNILKGANLAYDPETGEVDYDASDATVVVRFKDGHKKLVSIRDIDMIDEAVPADRALEMAREAAEQQVPKVDVEDSGSILGQLVQLADGSEGVVEARNEDGTFRFVSLDEAGNTVERNVSEAEIVPMPEREDSVGGNPLIGRSLTAEEAAQVVAQMQAGATPAPQVDLTPESWTAQFGEDGIVATPIGEVKMGENQYLKLLKNDRGAQFGMIRPTLTEPDIIVEDASQAVGGRADRPSSMVFVKTFVKPNSQAVRYFTSITVNRDGMEVVVSNHLKEKSRVNNLLKNGKLQYRVYGGPQSEQGQLPVSATTPLTDAGVNNKATKNIPELQNADPFIGRSLTSEEAAQVVAQMQAGAVPAPQLELTPENWTAQFGEDGIVVTPIGEVKMGENQYLKLLSRKRGQYFGMIRPTLENPDTILEENDPQEWAERDTKLLFIKTFMKPAGGRYVHFESVTVRKDNREVSISSHEIEPESLMQKMHNDNIMHLNKSLFSSEGRLTEPRDEGSDLVPTPNDSDNKATKNIPEVQNIDPLLGRPLTAEDAEQVVVQMQSGAVPAPQLDLTPENWTAQFGEDGIVVTPIGEVKMGENQYLKLLKNDRGAQFGMIRPTLTEPDIIVEDASQAADGRTDRLSSMVFVKTFADVSGSPITFFTSVTVQRDGLEVSISSHIKEERRIKRLLKEGRLAYIKEATLPFEAAPSTQGDQAVVPHGATLDNKATKNIPKVQSRAVEIPRLKDGKPDWNAMPAEMLALELSESMGHDKAVERIQVARKVNQKGMEKLRKSLAEMGDLNKAIAAEQRLATMQSEDARLAGALDYLGVTENRASASETFGQEIDRLFPEGLPDVRSRVLADIARGQRFTWKDSPDGTKRGVATELGFKGNESERRARFGILGGESNGAKHVSSYVHELWEDSNGYAFDMDDATLRNEVIDVLLATSSRASAMEQLRDIASRGAEDTTLPRDVEDVEMMRAYEAQQEVQTELPAIDVEEDVPFSIVAGKSSAPAGVDAERFGVIIDQLKSIVGAENVVTDPTEMRRVYEQITQRDEEIRRQQVTEANERFNEQLERWGNGQMSATEYVEVGLPMGVMQSFMPDIPIILRQKVLAKSRKKHDLKSSLLLNMPQALAEPIFVFKNQKNTIGVLTQLKDDNGQNLFVAMELAVQKQMGHRVLEINDILSVHGRETKNIVEPIVANGSLQWVNKEKGLHWLSSAKSNSQAIANEVLVTATNIVTNFENPIIEPENVRRSIVADKTLVGVHNLSEDNILHAVRMGGLANPSLAVIDTDKAGEFDKFGDITLVAPRTLIGKQSGGNAGTFGADIYSPRYPHVENEYGAKLKDLSDKLDGFVRLKFDPGSPVAKQYARNRGYLSPANASNAERVLKQQSFMQAYYIENALGVELPHNASPEQIEMVIPGQGAYFDWVNNLLRDAAEREVVFNGYTPTGRRRYLTHTLDNISRLMKKQGRAGAEQYNDGLASLRAHLAPKFTTIEQIHKAQNRLQSPDEFKQTKVSFEQEYDAIMKELRRCNDRKDISVLVDEHLQDAIASKDTEQSLKKFGYNPPRELLIRMEAFRASLKQMPAEYFETKFERPVRLNEFVGAVVPDGISSEVAEALQEAGVHFVKAYDPSQPGARAQALKELAGALDDAKGVYFMRTSQGEVYGFTVNGKIYLDSALMNAETPIHEYTELWSQIVARENPELWTRGVELMKQTEVWDEVNTDPNYKELSEDMRISETLSRIVAADFAREQAKITDSVSLLGKLHSWLRHFWGTLKDTFSKWTTKELNDLTEKEFAKMPLRDFVEGVDLTKYRENTKTSKPRYSRDMIDRKVTTLEKLENKRARLLADRENVPNFDEQLRNVDSEIEAYNSVDYVAETLGKDGAEAESDTHLKAVEDAVYDVQRKLNINDNQVVVVRNVSELALACERHGYSQSAVADANGGVARGCCIGDEVIIRSDAMRSQREVLETVLHERVHYLTNTLISEQELYEAGAQIGVEYINQTLQKRSVSYLVDGDSRASVADGVAEMISRDIDILTRDGLMQEYLANEVAATEKMAKYMRAHNVPEVLIALVLEQSENIKADLYGKQRTRNQQTIQQGRRGPGGTFGIVEHADKRRNGQDDRLGDTLDNRIGDSTSVYEPRDERGGRPEASGENDGDLTPKINASFVAEGEAVSSKSKREQLIDRLRQIIRDNRRDVRTTALLVGRQVRKSLGRELIEVLGKRDFDAVVRQIESATIRQDAEKPLKRIAEIVVDLEIKRKKEKIDKLLKLRVQGELPRGVSVAATVDDKTRQFIETIRDNLFRPAAEVQAMLEEQGAELYAKIGAQLLENYQSAEQYRMEAEDIDKEIRGLMTRNTFLRKERVEANKAGDKAKFEALKREIADNNEIISAMEDERASIKEFRSRELSIVAGNLEGEVVSGREVYADWVQRQKERKDALVVAAFRDMDDGTQVPISDDPRGEWEKRWHKAKEFLLSPAYSMNYMLKMLSVNAPKGEGATYDHFMRSKDGYAESRARYYLGYEDFKAKLDEKARAVFGKSYLQVMAGSNKPASATITITDDKSKKEERTPTIGEALYICMVDKMTDGRVKLRKMGITEEQIDMLSGVLPEQYVRFAKWLQEEFLPERRKVYNETHLDVFGTQMARIDHYVPLKIQKSGVYQEVDGVKIDIADLPSAITGSIIRRKRNSVILNLHTNVLDLMLEHGQQMERWNAFTRIVQDMNGLLSSTALRRMIEFQHPGLHKKLQDAASIVAGKYRQEPNVVNDVAVSLSKLAASSKIAFRINTALKQVLSYPAFYAYCADPKFWGYLTKNLLPRTWGQNLRWCRDNVPSFRERWLGRMAGDEKLAQMTAPRLDKWIASMSRLGMLSNAAVDAVTCANGAKAVYDFRHEEYRKAGYDEVEADRRAKIDAALAINETQQSSEEMYLSSIQVNRDLFSVALSTFQNSNFAYLRKQLEAIDELRRDVERERKNRAEYYKEQGLSDAEAWDAAVRDVVKAKREAVLTLVTFTFVVNVLWGIGNSVWKYLFADDDDEAGRELATSAILSFLRNTLIGSIIEDVVDGYDINPVMIISDLNEFINQLKKALDEEDPKAWDKTAAYIVLRALTANFVGIDMNSFVTMYEGVAGMLRDGANVEDVMLLMNAPRSQAKLIAGKPKEGESLDDYQRRMGYIERRIEANIDKKQLGKWARNYLTYRKAEVLNLPVVRDYQGRANIPQLKEINISYNKILTDAGLLPTGDAMTPGASSPALQTKVRRIWDLELETTNMVVFEDAYNNKTRETLRLKQEIINEHSK